jgi:hypothetical protein
MSQDGTGSELTCAFVRSDALVHAVLPSATPDRPLCGDAPVHVRVDAPFEADDDLACERCAAAALRAG